MNELKEILPKNIWQEAMKYENLEEVRVRKNRPLAFRLQNSLKSCDYIVLKADIEHILDKITDYSLQSYIKDIKNGFITTKNGHRVGICGSFNALGSEIASFNEISSLNIRISKNNAKINIKNLAQVVGKNILIISPPNLGKTTLLRFLADYLSNQNLNIGIVDERYELSNISGVNIDIIDGLPKKLASLMLLKTMSPNYIFCDEITGESETLEHIQNAGVFVVATIHANSITDIKDEKILAFFDKAIEISFENGCREYLIKEM